MSSQTTPRHDNRGIGYCTCRPHDYPMRDCGIPSHRAEARKVRGADQ